MTNVAIYRQHVKFNERFSSLTSYNSLLDITAPVSLRTNSKAKLSIRYEGKAGRFSCIFLHICSFNVLFFFTL